MKTKLGLLLLMLLIAVGCGESERTTNLTACPDCGEKVSKRAAACPHCGAPTAEQPQPVPSDLPSIIPSDLPIITNTIGMTLTEIPAGTFMMGSPETEGGRFFLETQHKVSITKAFYMQTTEVTQGQWKEVMGGTQQHIIKRGANYPVVGVSWNDAVAYCEKLSEKEGKTYRLPTEAEWEYACRAGTKTAWSFGDNEAVLGDYAWYRENARDIEEDYAHLVGIKKRPNAFGLHDMHGNVQEWCYDYYGEDYYKQSPAHDPRGPASSSWRVSRGGAYLSSTPGTRSAKRNFSDERHWSGYVGFRVVRELD
jgi:formylglycine-generating enzyme required for sulfatase activity